MILHSKSIRGVTLIELLVVVAIVAVLVTAGYSSYSRIKQESKRSDAHSALIATEAIVERYLAENNKDNLDASDLALSQFAQYSGSNGVASDEGNYEITIESTSNGYTIAATAIAKGSNNNSCGLAINASTGQCQDTACRVIFIENGEHKSMNSGGTEADATETTCW